jgi:group I intron endonuclease
MKRDLTNVIGYIYKLTSPNGKVYIGQTINKKQRKRHYNSDDFKQQTKLWNSVECHKWKPADTYEIIEECLCGLEKENLNNREKYWIEYYDSFKNGLNCNYGGHGNLGHKHSEETLKKMSEAKIGVKHSTERNKAKSEYTKGRKHTEEAKNKMSKVKIERMNDETKDKIRTGLMGNKNGIGNKGNPKKVICLTNGVIYNSIKEACDELSLHGSGVVLVCKGKKEYTKGFKFKYYE